MSTTTSTKTYTADEYLALEIESDIRHEYCHGEIIPMTGGTPAHNEINSVFNALLRVALKGQPYSIFVTDQRLWIPESTPPAESISELYTYPDTMITPCPAPLKPGRKDTVMNPVLIAEVLSNLTQCYDRGDKFSAYRTISTLQEYVLIDQYKPHVEQYVKQAENQWLLTEHRGFNTTLALQSVSINIPLIDLYEAVDG